MLVSDTTIIEKAVVFDEFGMSVGWCISLASSLPLLCIAHVVDTADIVSAFSREHDAHVIDSQPIMNAAHGFNLLPILPVFKIRVHCNSG